MANLREIDMKPHLADLIRRGLVTEEELARRDLTSHRGFTHGGPVGGPPGYRMLLVQVTLERYDLDEAHERLFGVRRWRHVSVSVKGALDARLKDQQRIGRQRAPGERSPAPLPDWYELTHLAYGHADELGFDPNYAVWQYLPGRLEPGLNIAEALHLRQPA